MITIQTVSLHYKKASENSDKVYFLTMSRARGGIYTVEAEFGRRTQDFRAHDVKAEGVTVSEAEKVFNSVLASKLRKGYRLVSSSQAVN